jgi:hypothetical protein
MRLARRIPSFKSRKQVDWQSVDYRARSDAEIAAELGVSLKTVARHRREQGSMRQRTKLREDLWDLLPLGEVEDHLIAAELDVDRSTVARARGRRGIPSARSLHRRRGGEGAAK